MPISLGNFLSLGRNSVENTSNNEEEYREPSWNCEDAINEFLEEGRRKQAEEANTNFITRNMQITRTGYITNSELDYLVIDHKYQFSKMSQSANVAELSTLKENDLVQYWLEGNRCVRVTRINRELQESGWDEEGNESTRPDKNKLGRESVKLSATSDNVSILKGIIIAVRKLSQQNSGLSDVKVEVEILIEKDKQTIAFNLSKVYIDGPVVRIGEDVRSVFVPAKGDWISLTVSKKNDNEGVVIAIEPLRWNDFEGEVTRVGKSFDSRSRSSADFAIIDNELFVPADACMNGYRPLRGDWLGGLAFESSAPEGCSWRAVNVYPRPFSTFKTRTLSTDAGIKNVVEDTSDPELLKHLELNGDVHFGQVLVNESKKELISITNQGDACELLSSIRMGDSYAGRSSSLSAFEISMEGIEFPVKILPKERIDFSVICKPKQVGLENLRIYFEFSEKGSKISTYVEVDGLTPEMLSFTSVPASTRNTKSAGSGIKSFRNESQFVVPGERPIFTSKPREVFIQRLGSYDMPEVVKRCLESREDIVTIRPYLAEPLSLENYDKRFATLLHLEEFAIQEELDKYSMSCVFFSVISCSQMALKVPGLQEQRPSLLIGDKVVATDPSPNNNSPAYEGNICEVRTEDVLILFASSFHSSYNGDSYNVSFKFNRTPFRRCHQAVEFALRRLGRRVLFPQIGDVDGRSLKEAQTRVATRTHKPSNKAYFNQNQAAIDPRLYVPRLKLTFFTKFLNERQRMAVLRIIEGLARPVPYILYGPPGTGKTVTLVEVLLQLYQLPGSRILACAPSNSAADLLCVRLHELNELRRQKNEPALDMARLNAAQRKDSGMEDEIIMRYSKSLDDIESAVKCRIVVATCTTAGQMYTANVKPGSFTHVVIDEAGHATEPETLVPINYVDCRNGQIVLAGDPQQLGPILESRQSNVYGLQVSLLERLSKLPVYARDESRFSRIGDAGGYNPLVATKLVNNYRSHPCLFTVSSRCFYDNELVANAPIDIQNAFVSASENAVDYLPNPKMPLILHSVQGRDLREGESLSWFNCHEIMMVISYLRKLLIDGFDGKLVSEDDIGIITPYRKQIEKIRLFMERAGLPSVKVGTVEEFQGQERSVIILSIVRSTESANVRQALGFLANPKRMNVALTRAKSLLIVIANPFVLIGDPYWGEFTRYSVENGCCLASNDVLAQIRQRLENLQI